MEHKTDEPREGGSSASAGKRHYERPCIKRVDLALEETLSEGCKLALDAACVGPPIAAFNGGS